MSRDIIRHLAHLLWGFYWLPCLRPACLPSGTRIVTDRNLCFCALCSVHGSFSSWVWDLGVYDTCTCPARGRGSLT